MIGHHHVQGQPWLDKNNHGLTMVNHGEQKFIRFDHGQPWTTMVDNGQPFWQWSTMVRTMTSIMVFDG